MFHNLKKKIKTIIKVLFDANFDFSPRPESNRIVQYNPTINEDGLTTSHVCTFFQDEKFMDAYSKSLNHPILKNYIDGIHWRTYIACWFANHVKNLEGDYVECGVDRAVLSRAIVSYIDFEKLSSRFFLLDTFEGIPLNNISEEEYKINDPSKRKYQNTYDVVKERFKNYPNVILVKGIIPDTLEKVNSRKIAYLSIDLNNVNPEIAAAAFFWEKMVSGGIILLDDYAYHDIYRLQREAFDFFAKERGVKVLTLPSGQGIIFKP